MSIYKEDFFRAQTGMNLKDYEEKILNQTPTIPGIVSGMNTTYSAPSFFLENHNEYMINNNLRDGIIHQMYKSVPIDKKDKPNNFNQSAFFTKASTISMSGTGLTDYDRSNISSVPMRGKFELVKNQLSEYDRRWDNYKSKLESAVDANNKILSIYQGLTQLRKNKNDRRVYKTTYNREKY